MIKFSKFPRHRLAAPIPVLLLATVLAAAVPIRPAAASGYTLPSSTQLTAAAYGNGVYVVAGTFGSGAGAGNNFVTLTAGDGANWTVAQPLPSLSIGHISEIAYGNGVFVAIGGVSGQTQPGGVILTSGDGVHWSADSLDTTLLSDCLRQRPVCAAGRWQQLYLG